MKLTTKYQVGDLPLSEYPRPQMQREQWLCLNGWWDFTKVKRTDYADEFPWRIKVPFSPESALSGMEEGFSLADDEKIVYQRAFQLNEIDDCVLLHFGAVDQECEVFINGNLVCVHRGGFTPFTADISAFARIGENVLRVECTDETEKTEGARGKQSSTPGGIWYTKQSGIWQTVWLECVPKNHIRSLDIKTDVEHKRVFIQSDCDDEQTIRVYDGEQLIVEKAFTGGQVCVEYNFTLWSPENPKLYSFTVETSGGDKVRSYFGVRSFGLGKDEKGKMRLLFNGKPYFQSGLLDQGYWPDGLLTYPSDEAVVDELTLLKSMGFNMLRKHIKIEPLRWYYHCDRLGLIVWQDFVSGGGIYNFAHIAALPFLGFKHKDDDYKYFARESENGRIEFIESVRETINALKNCVCIGVWVPFNEGWGQFDSARITCLVKELDDTRVIDSVSGWHDQGVGKTELVSLHIYYTPLKVPKDPRPVVLSEFGGYSLKTGGHVFNEDKEFGYKKFKTQQEYADAVEKLYLKKLKPLIAKGLSACVYTQVSDVEEEINGLVTYDRKVVKMPIEKMKAIHNELYQQASLIKGE